MALDKMEHKRMHGGLQEINVPFACLHDLFTHKIDLGYCVNTERINRNKTRKIGQL